MLITQNPKVKHRTEKFGGLLKLEEEYYILGKKEYEFFLIFEKPVEGEHICRRNKFRNLMLNTLLKNKFLIKVKTDS